MHLRDSRVTEVTTARVGPLRGRFRNLGSSPSAEVSDVPVGSAAAVELTLVAQRPDITTEITQARICSS